MFITFQTCTLSDLELLQYVGRATYEPYYRHIWLENGLEWYMERCFGKEVLASELSDPALEYRIGRDASGQIAGFMKYYLHKPVPENGETNALFLEKIYLMPNFFRKGVGQLFLEAVEQKAVELHRNALWLNVMMSGPIAAYRKAGYEICGPTRFEYDLLKPEERGGFVMIKKI